MKQHPRPSTPPHAAAHPPGPHPHRPFAGPLHRRQFIGCCAGLAAGLFTTLDAVEAGAGDRNPDTSPARGAGPTALTATAWPPAARALVEQAFKGLDPAELWDVHAHLLGTGDAGSGCSVHPSLSQWWHPGEVLRRRVILHAGGVPADAPSIDRAFVAHLERLAAGFPEGARWLLFAFEQAHDDRGRPRPDWSTFHVPDAYAAAVAARRPDRFGWVASIHPFREDALERLEQAARDGALAVKWLPSAMAIDLRAPRCRPFYDAMARLGLPLVVHCGEEHAVPGAGRGDLGNPLHVRAPLEAGVQVIMAHCASLGSAEDSDARSRRSRPAFDLFARLMDEPAHGSRLWGDVSAVFQVNRARSVWHTLLERPDWHARLLHGSDHPLPGVGPLVSLHRLAAADVLAAQDIAPLQAIRAHNPLLFDVVLKRRLRGGAGAGLRLADAVFQTRRAFPRAAAAPPSVSPNDTRRRAR